MMQYPSLILVCPSLWLALERSRGTFNQVIIETADSLDSINATTSSIWYVSRKQAFGSEQDPSHWDPPTRNGDAYPQELYLYKMFKVQLVRAVKGGVRNGAAHCTIHLALRN